MNYTNIINKIFFIFITLTLIFSSKILVAELNNNLCAKYLRNNSYRQIMNYYFRINNMINIYGCDLIPLYYAFNEKNELFLDYLEITNDKILINQLIKLFKLNPELADVLKSNSYLAYNISNFLINKNTTRDIFLTRLANLNVEILKNLSEKDVPYFALTFLVDGMPPIDFLKKELSSKEAELLLALLFVAAVDESGQYKSFLTDTPKNTINLYRLFISEWGIKDLNNILVQTPDAISDLLPPMSWVEVQNNIYSKNLFYQKDVFLTFQANFIKIQRQIYNKTKNEFGAAWASLVVGATASPLISELYGLSPDKVNEIQSFLSWFITSNSFNKATKNYCNLNGQNFSIIMGTILSPGNLVVLSSWYKQNKFLLTNLFDYWSKEEYLGSYDDNLNNEQIQNIDYISLSSIIKLAIVRANFKPESQVGFDNFLQRFRPQESIKLRLIFLYRLIEETNLFKILIDRSYSNTEIILNSVVNFPYKSNNNFSLYDTYNSMNSVKLSNFINEKLSFPDENALINSFNHNMTKAELVDNVFFVAEVVASVGAIVASCGGGAAATAATGGAGAPVGVAACSGAISAVGARVAAKTALKIVFKNKFKSFLVKQGGKMAFKVGARALARQGSKAVIKREIKKSSIGGISNLVSKAVSIKGKIDDFSEGMELINSILKNKDDKLFSYLNTISSDCQVICQENDNELNNELEKEYIYDN
jgi:hypothetical protein